MRVQTSVARRSTDVALQTATGETFHLCGGFPILAVADWGAKVLHSATDPGSPVSAWAHRSDTVIKVVAMTLLAWWFYVTSKQCSSRFHFIPLSIGLMVSALGDLVTQYSGRHLESFGISLFLAVHCFYLAALPFAKIDNAPAWAQFNRSIPGFSSALLILSGAVAIVDRSWARTALGLIYAFASVATIVIFKQAAAMADKALRSRIFFSVMGLVLFLAADAILALRSLHPRFASSCPAEMAAITLYHIGQYVFATSTAN
jgi:uncharacterized membrane protein YhhN